MRKELARKDENELHLFSVYFVSFAVNFVFVAANFVFLPWISFFAVNFVFYCTATAVKKVCTITASFNITPPPIALSLSFASLSWSN